MSIESGQPSLFDDPDAKHDPPVDAEAALDDQIARIGALPSKRKPEDDRLSEAHADQTGVKTAWEGALSRRAREDEIARNALRSAREMIDAANPAEEPDTRPQVLPEYTPPPPRAAEEDDPGKPFLDPGRPF